MRYWIVFVALCLATLGSAQVSQTASGYLFRLKMEKGESIAFQFDGTISGMGDKPFEWEQGLSLSFRDVERDLATVNANLTALKIGDSRHGPQERHVFTLDRQGRFRNSHESLFQSFQIRYPQSPVRIGTTWQESVPLNIPLYHMPQRGIVSYRMEGIEFVEGKGTAKLFVTVTGSGPNAIQGTGNVWVSIEDGFPVTGKLDLTIKLPQTQTSKDNKLTIEANLSRGG